MKISKSYRRPHFKILNIIRHHASGCADKRNLGIASQENAQLINWRSDYVESCR
ncbi:hypothetical protein ES705_34709 [subsurface metagenome]